MGFRSSSGRCAPPRHPAEAPSTGSDHYSEREGIGLSAGHRIGVDPQVRVTLHPTSDQPGGPVSLEGIGQGLTRLGQRAEHGQADVLDPRTVHLRTNEPGKLLGLGDRPLVSGLKRNSALERDVQRLEARSVITQELRVCRLTDKMRRRRDRHRVVGQDIAVLLRAQPGGLMRKRNQTSVAHALAPTRAHCGSTSHARGARVLNSAERSPIESRYCAHVTDRAITPSQHTAGVQHPCGEGPRHQGQRAGFGSLLVLERAR